MHSHTLSLPNLSRHPMNSFTYPSAPDKCPHLGTPRPLLVPDEFPHLRSAKPPSHRKNPPWEPLRVLMALPTKSLKTPPCVPSCAVEPSCMPRSTNPIIPQWGQSGSPRPPPSIPTKVHPDPAKIGMSKTSCKTPKLSKARKTARIKR